MLLHLCTGRNPPHLRCDQPPPALPSRCATSDSIVPSSPPLHTQHTRLFTYRCAQLIASLQRKRSVSSTSNIDYFGKLVPSANHSLIDYTSEPAPNPVAILLSLGRITSRLCDTPTILVALIEQLSPSQSLFAPGGSERIRTRLQRDHLTTHSSLIAS